MQDDKSLCAAVTICVTLVNIQSCSGWIAKWVASSGRVPKGPGSIPSGAEVLSAAGICKYLPVSVSSYVEVCLCLLCSVCIT